MTITHRISLSNLMPKLQRFDLLIAGIPLGVLLVILVLHVQPPAGQFALGNLDIDIQSVFGLIAFILLLSGMIVAAAYGIARFLQSSTGSPVEGEPAVTAGHNSATWFRRHIFIHVVLIVLLASIATLIAYYYVSNENDIYFYDYAQYQDRVAYEASVLASFPQAPVTNPIRFLRDLWFSSEYDYSNYHAVLPAFFMLVLGNSRLVYILSSVCFYLIPYLLVCGALAVKLIRGQPRLVFWSTAFLGLLVSATWLPTLRGYPDSGSAALVGLGILAYLHDRQLRHKWQFVVMGMGMALAVLFRRHFLYDVIAIFFVMGVQIVWDALPVVRFQPREAVRGVLVRGVRVGLLGISMLVFLAFLGAPFLRRLLTTNFNQLYVSYERGVGQNLVFFVSHYGYLAVVAITVALIIGLRTKLLARPAAFALIVFQLYVVIQWVLVVKQLGFHYTAHFTLGIILGLAVCLWLLIDRLADWQRGVGLLIFTAFIAFNFWAGLSPEDVMMGAVSYSKRYDLIEIPEPTPNSAGREWFARNSPPLIRHDYEAMEGLVRFFQTEAEPDSVVYLAASSILLSGNHLWHTMRIMERSSAVGAREIISADTPTIDSTGFYPISELIRSDYVVITNPMQYHLDADDHDILRVVLDIFQQGWLFAQDFERLPMQIRLEDDVIVEVYKRKQATSYDTALKTFRAMQDAVGTPPGINPLWINLNAAQETITENSDGVYTLSGGMTDNLYFLFRDRIDQAVQLTGRWPLTQCGSLSILLTGDEPEADVLIPVETSDAARDFSVELTPSSGSANLILVLTPTNGETCPYSLQELSVRG
ncbi:MAG: hypothetical protein K8J31_18710 [Anaerolineae bacterium]|nr:hypothetical protein [Anaerolineae bacterium]